MGRKREKELGPGSKTTLYIPQEINSQILAWMNEQNNLSPEIFKAIDFYIKHKDEINNSDIGNIDIKKLIAEEISKQLQGINTNVNEEVVTEEKPLTRKQKMLREKLK